MVKVGVRSCSADYRRFGGSIRVLDFFVDTSEGLGDRCFDLVGALELVISCAHDAPR